MFAEDAAEAETVDEVVHVVEAEVDAVVAAVEAETGEVGVAAVIADAAVAEMTGAETGNVAEVEVKIVRADLQTEREAG